MCTLRRTFYKWPLDRKPYMFHAYNSSNSWYNYTKKTMNFSAEKFKGSRLRSHQKDPLSNRVLPTVSFVDSCNRYKDMCELTNPAEIRNELRSACSTEVNSNIVRAGGGSLLKEVHRQSSHNMRQQDGKSVSYFFAKLRLQAKFCEFTVWCPNKNCNQ